MVDGMRSRRGRLVWALAGVLALTGCTQPEADGAEPPTVTQSPQETVEPTSDAPSGDSPGDGSEDPPEQPEVEAPARPAAMDEETVDGAIAAAKYFMELYPYIYATGDLDEWDALSDEGCGFCRDVREEAVGLNEAGGYSTGGDVEIYSSDGGGPYDDELADNAFVVELGIRIAESADHLADGTTERYPAEDHPRFRIALTYEVGGWSVLDAWRAEEL